jgi:hypothetical protein
MTMSKTLKATLCLVTVLAVGAGGAGAGTAIDFNFAGSTPVGAWQEREQITDQNGKKTVAVTKVKYLGDEERNGETYAWIETEVNNFKVKKDKRKPKGDTMVVKVLIKKSMLEGDVVNAVGNFNDLAVEVIMQSGDANPMRIKNAGEMMGGAAQAMGLQLSYEFSPDGSESVAVPAGDFDCDRYRGKGTATVDLMIKKMRVDSTSVQWISKNVPFGVVKVISDDVVNGKPQHSETVLKAYGTSGAVSLISGEIQDMPAMPSLGQMFGGGGSNND